MINYYIPEEVEDIKKALTIISLHNELTRLINEQEVEPPKGLYPYLRDTHKKGKSAGIEVMQFILNNLNMNLDSNIDIPEFIYSLCKIRLLSDLVQSTNNICFYCDKSSVFRSLFKKQPSKGEDIDTLFNYDYTKQNSNMIAMNNPVNDNKNNIEILVEHIKVLDLSLSEKLSLIKKII